MIDTWFIGGCYPGWDCWLAYGSVGIIILCGLLIAIIGSRQ